MKVRSHSYLRCRLSCRRCQIVCHLGVVLVEGVGDIRVREVMADLALCCRVGLPEQTSGWRGLTERWSKPRSNGLMINIHVMFHIRSINNNCFGSVSVVRGRLEVYIQVSSDSLTGLLCQSSQFGSIDHLITRTCKYLHMRRNDIPLVQLTTNLRSQTMCIRNPPSRLFYFYTNTNQPTPATFTTSSKHHRPPSWRVRSCAINHPSRTCPLHPLDFLAFADPNSI